jgi:hypothetical protein
MLKQHLDHEKEIADILSEHKGTHIICQGGKSNRAKN